MRRVQGSEPLSDVFLQQDKARRIVTALANTDDPEQANRAITLAQQMGANLKQNVYEGAAHAHASWKQWKLVLDVVALGMKYTGKTTARLLNWKIAACMALGHYASLVNILDEFDQYEVNPNPRTFHLLVVAHVQNHDLENASYVLQRMDKYGVAADPSTHAVILTAYRALGSDVRLQDKVLESLADLPVPLAVAVLNACMQVRLDARDLAGAANLLLYFDYDLISPIYTAIIGAPTMPEPPHGHRAYPPDVQTFIIYINQAAARHDLESGLLIFEGLRRAGIAPDSDVVVSLLHLHFTSGHADVAMEMVRRMCKHGASDHFSPTSCSLPLDTAGITPTTKVFNALLRGLLKLHGADVFYDVLALMRANGVIPNATTIEILMSHLQHEERAPPRSLIRLLRSVSADTDMRPTLKQMHIILNAILKEEKRRMYGHRWESLYHHVHHGPLGKADALVESKDTLDPSAGLDKMMTPKSRRATSAMLDSLRDEGVRADAATFAMRIRHEGLTKADLDAARQVFHSLLVRGMPPNQHHFAALMEGYAAHGDVGAAHGVLEAARHAGVPPNVVMYTILIYGHARAGDPRGALRTFERMVESGVRADVPAIDAVAGAFFAVGEAGMARRVLVGLWAHVGPFPEELREAPLVELAAHFRGLHGKAPRKKLTWEEIRALRREVRGLVKAYKRIQYTVKGNTTIVAQRPQSDADPS
ncbi:hypothetical protein HDZ31DRAFT_28197 [Schizophyllum fasciatum]